MLSADYADFRRLLRAKELKAEGSRLKAEGSRLKAEGLRLKDESYPQVTQISADFKDNILI